MTDPSSQFSLGFTHDSDNANLGSATSHSPDCAALADLVQALPCLVATVGPDEHTVFVSESVRTWLGAPPEELIGKHLSHAVGLHTLAQTRGFVSAALTGLQQRFEHALTLPTGAVLHAQVDLIPTLREGQPHGFHLLVTDISDRVLAEASLEDALTQSALLHERSRIAADMHDRVIQHLYAAGLGAQRAKSGDHEAGAYIDAMTICVNDAIRELRTAIRKLTAVPEPASIRAALTPIARQVSRWLGHDPHFTIRGRLDDIPPDAAHTLLLALSRMLAAVAIRSDVHDIHVLLAYEDDVVRARVSDDGLPPPDTAPAGPLAELRTQAENAAGGFTQQPSRPRGTVMEWWVPAQRST